MKRAWILNLPIFLCACGPTGIGTGIASLFGGDEPGGSPAALAFVDDFGKSTPANAKVSATPSGSRLVTNPRYEVSVAGVVAGFAVVVVTPDDVEVPELLPTRVGNNLVWEVPVSNALSEGWYSIRITAHNAFGPATITRAFFVEVGPPMSDSGVAGGVHVKNVVAIPEGDKTLVTVLWRAGAGDDAIQDEDLSRIEAFIVYAIPVQAKDAHRDTAIA